MGHTLSSYKESHPDEFPSDGSKPKYVYYHY